jgi:hypothetical protein
VSNFFARTPGSRCTSAVYRPGRSRRNSSENGTITASLYGVIVLFPSVGRDTGFASVSATHVAVGSPVMIGMETPRPGSAICCAAPMTPDASWVSCQMS